MLARLTPFKTFDERAIGWASAHRFASSAQGRRTASDAHVIDAIATLPPAIAAAMANVIGLRMSQAFPRFVRRRVLRRRR
jgi:hypothetical protein